ncbi:Protein ALTERED XYLOGLUCAN 4 [Abeliophyllum distichum]|uniref:Protein ALTERED XYLOGLUCAN 4 n=1 Tax=Abeliophyllum distichum TaxID=126358 RepID=A0ABD1RBG1_9LAMI
MGSSNINPFKDQPNSFAKKFLPYTLLALLPIALLHLYFYPFYLSPTDQLSSNNRLIIPSPPLSQEERKQIDVGTSCDYSNGKWVPTKLGPLYNGTTCGTIKQGQNCMVFGRPDKDYLYWKWTPNECKLPRFDPKTFLKLLKNKHIAFVGDSLARNQLESLLCLVATASNPNLIYTDGEDNKFRKWNFPSHNISVSIYWSPFLVRGIEKTLEKNFNRLYLDSVDERWASDMDHIDILVLSMGHWYLHPAVYYYGDSVLGCHYCQNYTEIGFYDVFGKALNTTFQTVIERRSGSDPWSGSGSGGSGISVVLTTFSPAHFEGEWDKFGACPKIKPYDENEKKLEGMDYDMRKVDLEQVKFAKLKAEKFGNIRFEALDVTKLALLRPDGHPGPYMNPFPFANGIADRVPNDCVHWCLPGAIDTWNEILLDVMKRWENKGS